MPIEITTQQLTAVLNKLLASRRQGTAPTQLNLQICPALEGCDGPAGPVTFRFHTYNWMSNPIGITHGGMIAAILDAGMGILSASLYGSMTPTITMTTNYCRPVPLEADVLVRVRAAHAGGTSCQLTAEMYLPDAPEQLLATATGVYYTAGAKR